MMLPPRWTDPTIPPKRLLGSSRGEATDCSLSSSNVENDSGKKKKPKERGDVEMARGENLLLFFPLVLVIATTLFLPSFFRAIEKFPPSLFSKQLLHYVVINACLPCSAAKEEKGGIGRKIRASAGIPPYAFLERGKGVKKRKSQKHQETRRTINHELVCLFFCIRSGGEIRRRAIPSISSALFPSSKTGEFRTWTSLSEGQQRHQMYFSYANPSTCRPPLPSDRSPHATTHSLSLTHTHTFIPPSALSLAAI